MKYTLYTGCMIPVTAPNYEVSARRVCDSLNIDLELLNAPCCGNPISPVDYRKAVNMALNVLGLASEKGRLMTLCSACTSSLLEAQKKMDTGFLDRLQLDKEKIQALQINHFINVLYEDIGLKILKKRIKIPLDQN